MRVTVVGDRVFATRITPAADDPQIDWRMGQANAGMCPVDPPTPIHERIIAFQRHFGLNYGAYDFIASADTAMTPATTVPTTTCRRP